MAPESAAYLERVLEHLALLDIPAVPSPRLIRGLDYYAQTIWEITHDALGAQDALAGGGRYRIESGDRTLEGVGFAIGLERVILALAAAGIRPEDFGRNLEVWLVTAGAALQPQTLRALQTLRTRGIACGADLTGRSVKAQMRAAHRAGVSRCVVLGESEWERGIVLLKNMADGSQEEIPFAELSDRLRSGLDPASESPSV
ncbi:MAG: His/Gly/Thr/Pro-type tRNA ligase C-terminal domain-containing protein [Kiritimatiellia bacterium]|nr:His/Gly/Thr/Pro-type tRNA ligase C-terminal domain-containing protein [Kiritimatiellia bacterium]